MLLDHILLKIDILGNWIKLVLPMLHFVSYKTCKTITPASSESHFNTAIQVPRSNLKAPIAILGIKGHF